MEWEHSNSQKWNVVASTTLVRQANKVENWKLKPSSFILPNIEKQRGSEKSTVKNFCLNGHFRCCISSADSKPPCTASSVLQESTPQELSWSHCRISSGDSEVRATLCSVINSTRGNYCSVALSSFHLNGHTKGFHPQTQRLDPSYSKQHESKVLPSSFHLNGQTSGFYPQPLKLELHHSRARGAPWVSKFANLINPKNFGSDVSVRPYARRDSGGWLGETQDNPNGRAEPSGHHDYVRSS